MLHCPQPQPVCHRGAFAIKASGNASSVNVKAIANVVGCRGSAHCKLMLYNTMLVSHYTLYFAVSHVFPTTNHLPDYNPGGSVLKTGQPFSSRLGYSG